MTTPTTPREGLKHPNPMRITFRFYCEQMGITPDERMDHLEELASDCVCPALCRDGCEVEPDGECEHGCPSILRALGFI